MLDTAQDMTEVTDPFTYHVISDVLTPQDVALLETTAPVDGAEPAVALQPGREKNYRMNILYLMYQDETRPAADALTGPWETLYDELTGDAFLDWLTDNTRLPLREAKLDLAVYRHVEGDFISVHKDKTEKLLTAIVYLNSSWPTDGGGAYEVRSCSDPAVPPARSLPPRGGSMLAFPPSERSWHSVGKVKAGTPTRLTVQLEFWKP
ncbi:2OG-Fe(II) oxygenase [Streptomyces sp. NBC_01465]|uniref:2OG-Fe(II) oxygenase n=1 Tax=Streptomyces sp. NBC_01465 TaxID=2903878 RepID=UPI002E302CCF|nr:2OG-Fe(II) oxygenase [Streptomyces sp. NBC_01465]